MKMPLLLSVFALCAAAGAQCYSTYPTGVVTVSVSSAPCNDIGGASAGPWMSPNVAISSSLGANPLTWVWSNLPQYFPQPGVFYGVVAVDIGLAPSPITLTLGGVTSPCVGSVGGGLVLDYPIVYTSPIGFNLCQSTYYAVVPPIPGIAGLDLFGQGYLLDLTINKWATSNVWKMTVQP